MLPVANPKLNLNDYAFSVVKVSLVSSPLSQGGMHDTAQTWAAPEWGTTACFGLHLLGQDDTPLRSGGSTPPGRRSLSALACQSSSPLCAHAYRSASIEVS